MTGLYVVVSILLLGLLIVIHEAGHLTVAKLFGFPVDEFSIGMGPKLWQTKRNGTKYSLRAIPMGGYVAFESIEDAQAEELEFQKHPIWQRFFVLLAGPGMNVVLAIVLMIGLLAFRGTAVTMPRIDSVIENTPAQEAGLEAGDTFLSVNGVSVDGSYEKLNELLNLTDADSLHLVMDRNGNTVEADLVPRYVEEENRWQIGVYLAQEFVPYPLGKAIVSGFTEVRGMTGELLSYLGQMITGKASTQDMAGVVGTVALAAQTGAEYGFGTVMYLFVFISVNLGIMNLLPLPALDGGKIFMLLIELIRGKPLDAKYEGWISLAGLAAFAVLFVLLTYQDISRIIMGG